MPNRAYKYRFYPNQTQKKLLLNYFGSKRFIWNRALDFIADSYQNHGEKITWVDFSRELTWLKKFEPYHWLNDTPATVYTQCLRDLNTAYQKFFKEGAGYPVHKKRIHKQSIRMQLDQRIIMNNYRPESLLKVPGLGALKVRWSRRPIGIPKMVTISKDHTDRYYVSLSIEEDIKALPVSRNRVGIDLGTRHAMTLSTGEQIENPRYLNHYQAQLKRLQQRLSRQQKGSTRWDKTRQRIARKHLRIANCRQDFIHKLTTDLIRHNQLLAIEDLFVKGITASAKGDKDNPGKQVKQKAGLNRSLLDVSFAEIVRQLEYKAKWYGRELVKVDRFFPSSKRCCECGYTVKKMPLDIRTYNCPECGNQKDRDHNAAINILMEALGITPAGSLAA